jgi:hypothetical protein
MTLLLPAGRADGTRSSQLRRSHRPMGQRRGQRKRIAYGSRQPREIIHRPTIVRHSIFASPSSRGAPLRRIRRTTQALEAGMSPTAGPAAAATAGPAAVVIMAGRAVEVPVVTEGRPPAVRAAATAGPVAVVIMAGRAAEVPVVTEGRPPAEAEAVAALPARPALPARRLTAPARILTTRS